MSRDPQGKSRMKTILSLSLGLILPLTVHAQTAAKILGVVHDQNGQPVGAARVEAVGQKSVERRKIATSPNGEFALSELPPDMYQITATCDTCNDASSLVEVGAGQSRSIQLEVNTKSSSDVISLDTHAASLDTTSATLGVNVSGTEVGALPVNGRTVGPLALIAPFVTNAGTANYSQIRFAGQSIEQNSYTLDGVDASSVVTAAPGFIPVPGFDFRLRTSLDSTDEFRVNSVAYAAEDGGVTGAQVKLVSRAGAQGWHGSLFEYFRNDKLQARNFFDGSHPTELRMNQYGGNAGGEVVKEKAFLFGSFEQLKQRAGLNIFETVPSNSARARAGAALAPVLAAMPVGFRATNDPDIAQSLRQDVARQDENNLNVRVDYLPNAKNRVFARYSRASGSLLSPDNTTSLRDIVAKSTPDQSVLHWTYQLTSNVMNSLTAGINRAPTQASVAAQGSLGNTRVAAGLPIFGGIDSAGGLTRMSSGDFASGESYHGRSYNLANTVSWIKGGHSFSFGGDVRAIRMPFSRQGGTFFQYEALDTFLANVDAGVTYVADLPVRFAEQEQYGWFVEDQWRVSPQFALNLGLRYDYFSATREQHNAASLLNLATLQSTTPHGGLYPASSNGLQPRLAMTWAPKRLKGDTVIRVGAGIYNGTNAFLDTLLPIQNTAPRYWFNGLSFPQTLQTLQASGLLQQVPRAIDPNSFGKQQQTYTYTVSVQQALPHQFVGQAAYFGSVSRHLTQEAVTNIGYGVDPAGGNVLRPIDGYLATHYLTNGGNSSYNAFQLGLNRHLVDNLTLSASYNLSHSIGNTQGAGDELAPQDPTCLRCERADNSFDVRQTFNATAVYELPFGRSWKLSKNWLRPALAGWTFSGGWNARTGLPVNVTMQRSNEIDYSPSTGQFYSPYAAFIPNDVFAMVNVPYGGEDRPTLRPDAVPGVSPYLKSGGTAWLNPAAFAIPAAGAYGNLGRNALRGPGFSQVDLAFSRTFAISEQKKFEIRAEAFNLLNHANFSNPTALLPDALIDAPQHAPFSPSLASGFGMVNSTVGRTVGLGTSRQIQFGARFVF